MCFFFKQKTAYVMRIGDWSSDLCSSDLLGRKFGTVVSANTHLTDRLTAGGVAGVVTLPMGVDPGIFAPAHRDRHLRRELLARCALPDSASLLVGLGRPSAENRWPMVIDAWLAAGRALPIGLVPGFGRAPWRERGGKAVEILGGDVRLRKK